MVLETKKNKIKNLINDLFKFTPINIDKWSKCKISLWTPQTRKIWGNMLDKAIVWPDLCQNLYSAAARKIIATNKYE